MTAPGPSAWAAVSQAAVCGAVRSAARLLRDGECYARARAYGDDPRGEGAALGFLLAAAHELVDDGAREQDVRALLAAAIELGRSRAQAECWGQP